MRKVINIIHIHFNYFTIPIQQKFLKNNLSKKEFFEEYTNTIELLCFASHTLYENQELFFKDGKFQYSRSWKLCCQNVGQDKVLKKNCPSNMLWQTRKKWKKKNKRRNEKHTEVTFMALVNTDKSQQEKRTKKVDQSSCQQLILLFWKNQ